MKKADERKRRVLGLLTLGGFSIAQAAAETGLTGNAIRAWLRKDPKFREEIALWRSGPPLDPVTVAQTRRAIVEELARRIVCDGPKLSQRELLQLQERFLRMAGPAPDEDPDRPLTREECLEVFAEADREEREAARRRQEHPGAPEATSQPAEPPPSAAT